MDKVFIPLEEMIIDSLETLKVISDPFRIQILQILGHEAKTVKMVAHQLEVTPNKLYYHINLMESHDLIQVVDTQVVSGIIEKWYQCSARSYRPAPNILIAEEDRLEINTRILDSVFDSTRDDIIRAMRKGIIEERTSETPEVDGLMLNKISGYLTPEQYDSFRERIKALIKELGDCGDENAGHPDRMRFGLNVAYYQMDDPDLPPEGDEDDSQ